MGSNAQVGQAHDCKSCNLYGWAVRICLLPQNIINKVVGKLMNLDINKGISSCMCN